MRRLLLALVAVSAYVVPVHADANTVDATCDFSVSGLQTSRNVLVSITATATATGSATAALTSVRCEIHNSYGESVAAETAVPGPRAAIVGEGILQASTLTRCLTAHATWVLPTDTATYSDC